MKSQGPSLLLDPDPVFKKKNTEYREAVVYGCDCL
jgi:hypothetical protein